MSLDEVLRGLDRLAVQNDVDVQRGLRRLQSGFRRLREDPREAQRIRDIGDLIEAARDAYELGELTLERGDLEAAERHFRRAAEADFDDAAHRLAQVIETRATTMAATADQLAETLLAEAESWYEEAREAGVPAASRTHAPPVQHPSLSEGSSTVTPLRPVAERIPPGDAPAARSGARRVEFSDGDRPRVLLVDDNSAQRRQLDELLTAMGIEVVGQAASGEDGFRLSLQLNPDIVVMDYRMPGGMDGIAATRRIISRLPHIRVVMLTVYDETSLMREARDAGATDYVVKGAPDILLAALERAWGGPDAA